MKAYYKPKNIDNLSSKMLEYSGRIFRFKHIFDINGKKIYEPDDKNFSESRPIPEEDLEEVEDVK